MDMVSDAEASHASPFILSGMSHFLDGGWLSMVGVASWVGWRLVIHGGRSLFVDGGWLFVVGWSFIGGCYH